MHANGSRRFAPPKQAPRPPPLFASPPLALPRLMAASLA
jgi:hypothetical protein